MARVTIQELAAQLNISKASVSYALNGQPGVSDATRERVLALAADLGWHPSSSARALSRSRADAIGMVLTRDPDLLGAEPYYMNLLSGVEDVLTAADQSLLLRMVGARRGRDIDVYRRWSAERRVDGVIVLDLAIDDPRPEVLTRLGMPFVLHGVHTDPVTHESLVEDQLRDAATIIQHLAELGHRDVLHLTGPLYLAHELNRRHAIAAETSARGMHVTFLECDYTMATAEQLTVELIRTLRDDELPTALIASNDVMALGAATALRHTDRSDIALISWDDSMICQIAVPTVTALARHVDDQGRRSARKLLALLTGEPSSGPEQQRSILNVRETSLSPRKSHAVMPISLT